VRRPVAARDAGDDRSGRFHGAHVRGLPPERIEDPFDLLLRARVVPQMNIVGVPPAKWGSTICSAPAELNALTKCAAG
jgi:hypothetical protein